MIAKWPTDQRPLWQPVERSGCLGCGSECGIDGCNVCQGKYICSSCLWRAAENDPSLQEDPGDVDHMPTVEDNY